MSNGLMVLKRCSKCHDEKILSAFKRDKRRRKDGRASWCKECHNAAALKARLQDPQKFRDMGRKRRIAQPEKIKAYQKKSQLFALFGLSVPEFEIMRQDQKGLCAICHMPETIIDHRTGRVYDLSVDHNHTTGTVRNLLCRKCNLAVGHIEESIAYAHAVVAYIVKWDGK